MPPIRIAIIGLSTSSKGMNWAAHAHLPYLQSPKGREKYTIVALCNSSIASAEKSKEFYKLATTVKTYDSASALACDSDVDLIVNVTGVEHHYELMLPLVQAGKNVMTELPLALDVAQIQELVDTTQQKNCNTVFAIQGQTSPVTKLLKDIISQGKIGKVLSSTWIGSGWMLGEKPIPVALKFLTERKAGRNLMSLVFLHTINYFLATLGEISTFHSILGNQRPNINLMDPKQGGKIIESVRKDTPDQILLQGRLESGALFSYHLRGGDTFPGQPSLTWLIYGETGEIRITSPNCVMDVSHSGANIKLHEFGQEVRDLEVPEDEMSGLAHPGQNVGRIYEAYAKGEEGGEMKYPDWGVGMKRHELIEEMWKREDGSG